MNATNAMFHLDAAARSVPEPTFPPDALNSDVSDILRATRPFLDTDRDVIIPNIEDLRRQVSTMSVYSSALAPVRRLSIDVLKSVFREIQISQWQTISRPNWTSLEFSQGPWTLSHVCSAWRDVILSYPKLWSHIVFGSGVSFAFNRPGAYSRIPVALEAMITRSEQCPLDIVFRLDFDYDEDMAEKVFAMILEESHRWRTLGLLIPLHFLERLKVVRRRIPCLESLTLHSWETLQAGRAELAEDIRSLFADAHGLRNITLHGNYGHSDLIFPRHITHLATSVGDVSNLGIYQSLVECHLQIEYGPTGNSDIPLPLHIFLPNVQRLLVPSLRMLAHFCLPSLRDLTFTHDVSDIRGSIEVVNDFLFRSRCSLTRLAFYSAYEDNQILIQDSLLFMDTVVCLEVGLRVTGDDKDILNALTSDKFLPNLQDLHLFHFGMSSSQTFLIALVMSCRQHLLTVKVSCSASEDVKRLNEQFAPIQHWPGQHFIAAMERNDRIWHFGNFILSNLDDEDD
ncbi:hypothetical protein IW262DRAFT_1494317 [Armillaria fumosa]|nr:hypothetical protein IW262DRAFT_1494317 [Armillaria fumosa]